MLAAVDKSVALSIQFTFIHGDVIIWPRFMQYWPFVKWIHLLTVYSPKKASNEILLFQAFQHSSIR